MCVNILGRMSGKSKQWFLTSLFGSRRRICTRTGKKLLLGTSFRHTYSIKSLIVAVQWLETWALGPWLCFASIVMVEQQHQRASCLLAVLSSRLFWITQKTLLNKEYYRNCLLGMASFGSPFWFPRNTMPPIRSRKRSTKIRGNSWQSQWHFLSFREAFQTTAD